MNVSVWKSAVAGAAVLAGLIALASANAPPSPPPVPSAAAAIPPSRDPANIYADAGLDMFSPAVAGALSRVYVPLVSDNMVMVIDPATMKVVDRYSVPGNPQHVVPSWDLKTLWVASSQPSRVIPAAMTPIDPKTGKVGKSIVVPDAYNLYFLPDGSAAIIVAEAMATLEFRDPQTMALISTLPVPDCAGINHADFSIDGRYAIFTCEFGGGALVKIDLAARKVVGTIRFPRPAMPQDIRSAPDGSVFYVADMLADGLHIVDVAQFKIVGFVATGVGAHSVYPSRDGKKLYVGNRGSHNMMGMLKGPGSVSVFDFATRTVEANWPIPGGGSPDMGNISADGKTLWLSARYDNVVYAIDTTTGATTIIPVGTEPHGLAVWPQPGRYSLGHTGLMR